MAGTVTMGGLASGMDVEGLISGLVKANQVTLNKLQVRAASFRSASSTLSDIGTALSALHKAGQALSSVQGVGSMSATSSGGSVVASASGAALPGAYKISVTSLAAEQRTYSKTFSSNSGALGESGQFTIQVGTGTATAIQVLATDSLDQIAGKINQAGLRVSASVFFDGTKHRLQVRGLDTGAANALTFVETGTNLDLNGTGATADAGKTVQPAKNAVLTIDDFTVSGSTNQIIGAIPGVTLALTAETTSPVTLTVGSDPAALSTKVTSFINSFNNVIRAAHTAAGFGTQAAKVPALAGDSALRTVTQRLSAAATKRTGSGTYQGLADIGISVDKGGMLALDSAKLTKALATDAAGVVKLLARPDGATTGGLMADLTDVVYGITDPTNGPLVLRSQAFTSQAKKLDQRATSEQDRLNQYADRLRKSLSDMDAKIGANKVLEQALANTFNAFNK